MLSSAQWHTYPRIIALTFTGVITLDDCYAAIEEIRRLVAAANLPDEAASVHILVDVTGRTGFSADIVNIRMLTQAALRIHRIGWIAVVEPQPNFLVQFAADTVAIRLGLRSRRFTTLAEASHFLQAQIGQTASASSEASTSSQSGAI
ncbi:MAG: hypothetical protein ACUVS2_00955 [Candidatus Flexifilum sp.]|jgi:hypothetical protein